ncbi:polyphosphate polymerase domain-containing protein [Lutimonas sp.]|uniref:polyphosphate polymerase domain-containing protein n=1 Tax=Lutimonas sp. TaxID=1872403 RepID=UPI003D9BE91E
MKILSSIERFHPISLEEMDSVSLLKRMDTKFIMNESKLDSFLSGLTNFYQVLEIDGQRMMRYESQYYDTPERKFYKDHHNRKIRRVKIRIRNYIDSNSFFFEIKQKDAKGNTIKKRKALDSMSLDTGFDHDRFIKKILNKEFFLEPTVKNHFKRITLVNKALKERVTIDLNLSFNKEGGDIKFKDLVIIELKQKRLNRDSPVFKNLKQRGVLPYRISKYCIGMISTYKDIKYNRFKQKLLNINKITA